MVHCAAFPEASYNGSAEWPPYDRLWRVSSTPQPFDSIIDVPEYWIARFRGL
jgi:hypothetical protein